MIITRTPLRISFFGGGTDYPEWFEHHQGAVLGASINKYCYLTLHNGNVWSHMDLPKGAGLGSSSAYTVGLLRACTSLDKVELAKLAIVWERDKLNQNIGCQDQYLCSIGGVHYLRFSASGVTDNVLPIKNELTDRLMLFDTHHYRLAGNIVAAQQKRIKHNERALERLTQIACEGYIAYQDDDWRSFGDLLNEAWELKKSLSPKITNSFIDGVYTDSTRAGAISGKLLGAGGGGFILFYVEPGKQEAVKNALNKLTYVPFNFENTGSRVIFDDKRRTQTS